MMDDDLKKLAQALRDCPTPDTTRKNANLSNAMDAFEAEFHAEPQETAAPARQTDNRSIWERLSDGGSKMIATMTSRGALAATTGLVTAGLAVMIVLPQRDVLGPQTVGGEIVLTEDRRERSEDGLVAGADQPVQEQVATAGADDGLAREPARVAAPERTAVVPAEEGNVVISGDFGNTIMMDLDAAGSAAESAEAPVFSLTDTEEEARPRVMATPKPSMTAKKQVRSAVGQGIAGGALVENAPAASIVAPQPTPRDQQLQQQPNTERFANEEANPVKVVLDEPVSTFSVDVDTASYAVVRSSLMAGHLPPADAVRIEEMVNYFPYAYAAPESGGAPFQPTVTVTDTPWNDGTRLVRIALQGEMPAVEERPPLNLVFLIDTSGSMQSANKLPLLKQSFRLMLGQLRPKDQIAIVTYAGSAGQVLAPTPAGERATILSALDRLEAGGSTAGQAGLQQAYQVAEGMADEGDVTRVLLATDGDFNVGISDTDQLKDYIETKRDSGTYLSVLGFGRGNLNDALMQALAQNGNGQASYIDTIAEAQKVLVDQLTGALFPIAGDVKVQVEFNPAEVAEYRLIGYETRALKREDFNNDKVDAGEIGAGHQVTALYEVTPVGSPAVLNDPLRYQNEARPAEVEYGELGFLRLRWKEPGESVSQLIETPIGTETQPADSEAQFATAIAGFGQLLKGSDYLGNWGYNDALALASGARGEDPFGYRAEAIRLMRLAQSLSE